MERNEILYDILVRFYKTGKGEEMDIDNLDNLQVQVAFNSFHNCYDRFFRVIKVENNKLKLVKL